MSKIIRGFFFLWRCDTVPVRDLIMEASPSHSDTPHSVAPLWTSDQPVAETSTWQHTTLKRDRHECPRRYSNPQSQPVIGRAATRIGSLAVTELNYDSEYRW